MFVNYVREGTRDSPVNLAVARVLLGTYLVWKVLSGHWVTVAEWPVRINDHYSFLVPPGARQLLPLEAAVTALVLCGFVVGYRLAVTSFVSALLVGHLAAVRYTVTDAGSTDAYFFAVYFLAFFAIYHRTDHLSLDALRRGWALPSEELSERLRRTTDDEYPMPILALFLLTVAIYYAGSAWDKVLDGPLLAWTTAENMTRWVLVAQDLFGVDQWLGWRGTIARTIADFVYAHPSLGALLAWGTIALEAGFLVAILVGLPITPFVLGFVGMHASIAVLLGPFFLDNLLFLALFFEWDRVYERLAPSADQSVSVVYDERCEGCVRFLFVFELLDVTDSLRFYSRDTASDSYLTPNELDVEERDSLDSGTPVWVLDGTTAYAGFDAVLELARRIPPLVPIAWLLRFDPIARVGRRGYWQVVDGSSRQLSNSQD